MAREKPDGVVRVFESGHPNVAQTFEPKQLEPSMLAKLEKTRPKAVKILREHFKPQLLDGAALVDLMFGPYRMCVTFIGLDIPKNASEDWNEFDRQVDSDEAAMVFAAVEWNILAEGEGLPLYADPKSSILFPRCPTCGQPVAKNSYRVRMADGCSTVD